MDVSGTGTKIADVRPYHRPVWISGKPSLMEILLAMKRINAY
jgi:hypothetical protein